MHCFLKYWHETLANILKLIKFAHNIEIRQTEQTTEETKQPKTETGANNKGFGDSTTNKQQKRRNNFTSSKGVQQHGLPWQLWRTTQKGEVLKRKQTWVHDQEGGQRTYISYLGPHNAGRLLACPTGVLYAHTLPQSWTTPWLYLSNTRTPYLNPDSPYRYASNGLAIPLEKALLVFPACFSTGYRGQLTMLLVGPCCDRSYYLIHTYNILIIY